MFSLKIRDKILTNQVFLLQKAVENLNAIVCDIHCGRHNFEKEEKNGTVVTVSFPYVL